MTDTFERYIERSIVEETGRISDYYGERDGRFYVTKRDDDAVVGMFGLEWIDATTMEVRRRFASLLLRKAAVNWRRYSMSWKLDETVETSAGVVATGIAGDGPALVLAHGWPWSSFSWHRVVPSLAMRYRVHWYDMPGYGRSEKCAGQRTSLDVQGQVFAEMLAHWGLERPLVVAHDFGGATTLRAHLLHGCDFDRYVLMNVVAMRPWGSAFFDHVGRHVDAFLGLPPHIHEALVMAYIKGALITDIDPGDLEKLVEPWLSEEGRESFYRQFAQADENYTAEVEPLFGDIRCPVNIIWGEDDPWIPLERGKALHGLIPQASLETLSGVGHLPQLEAPSLVAERLRAFLSSESEG